MKKIVYVIFLVFLLLIACTGLKKQNPCTIVKLTDPNQHFETERLSFLPPASENWDVKTCFPGDGVITFYSTSSPKKGALRTDSVTIIPFPNTLGHGNFSKILDNDILQAKKLNARYEHLGNSPDRPMYKVNVVHMADMRCIQYESSITTPIAGKISTTTYSCEQPNQPKDLPLISIISTFSNTNEILAPIWSSIKFKPVDRTNSRIYQNWKIKNSEISKNKAYDEWLHSDRP